MGAGFGISRATAYRYRDEALDALAAQAPDLHEALGRGLVSCDLRRQGRRRQPVWGEDDQQEGKEIDVWHSGKTHDFGGNIQAVMRPDGFPVWVSDVEPGSVHDLVAARKHALGALCPTASRDLPVLADGGYEGAGRGVHTPVKRPGDGQQLDVDTRTYHMLLRSLRAPGRTRLRAAIRAPLPILLRSPQ